MDSIIQTNHYYKLGTFDSIPPTELFRRAVKIQLVGTLAWDYTDTVLDISTQMRLSELKPLSRAIKQLRSEYDYQNRKILDSDHLARLPQLAELFESINSSHFAKLCQEIEVEIKRDTSLPPEHISLLIAVQMAMSVLDALFMYADDCDIFIRKYYPQAQNSILPVQYRKIAILLPNFAIDGYDKDSKARTSVAKLLLNEINNIELYDENGKV